MTAQEAMDKLNEWRKKKYRMKFTYDAHYGWYLWVDIPCGIQCECGTPCEHPSKFWGSDWQPDLTDAVAEVAEKIERDLGE